MHELAGKILNFLKWPVGGFLIGCTSLAIMHAATFVGRGEKLTSGEDKLLHDFYGDSVETSGIRKHFIEEESGLRKYFMRTMLGSACASAGPGQHIIFSGTCSSDDYSNLSADGALRSAFMHEAEHALMQNFSILKRQKDKQYDYSLTDSSLFDDFGKEQRAAMVGDYTLRFLTIMNQDAVHQDKRECSLADADSLLARIVEAKYPSAKEFRAELKRTEQRRFLEYFDYLNLPNQAPR